MASRELTYDEKKAAEAAFRGLPLNPKWSAAARDVYEGIVHATQGKEAVHPLLTDLEEVSSSSPEASRELTVQEAQEEERPVQLSIGRKRSKPEFSWMCRRSLNR